MWKGVTHSRFDKGCPYSLGILVANTCTLINTPLFLYCSFYIDTQYLQPLGIYNGGIALRDVAKTLSLGGVGVKLHDFLNYVLRYLKAVFEN
jgi:hypothetical protein